MGSRKNRSAAAAASLVVLVASFACRAPERKAQRPALTPAQLDALEPARRRQIASEARAVEDRPEDPETHGRLAMLLHAEGFLEQAAWHYARSRHLDPGNARWHRLDAHRAAEAGQEAIALERALEAVALAPASVSARSTLAEIQIRRGDLVEAVIHLEAALEMDPTDAASLGAMGELERRRGDFAGAVVWLEKALASTPDDARLHYAISLAYARLGEQGRASEHMAAAREAPARRPAIAPPPEILALRRRGSRPALAAGTELLERGEIDEAVSQLRAAVEAEPGSADAHNTFAAALESAGRLEEARSHYERAILIDPDLGAARRNLGVLLGRLGLLREAVEHLEHAVRLEPERAEAHHFLAAALLAVGRFEKALEHERAALERDFDSADGYFTLGLALEGRGRTEEALTAFRSALARDGGLARAHLRMGLILGRTGRLAEARRHLENAAALDPDSADARHFLAVTLHQLGRGREAIEQERRALELAQGTDREDLLGTVHHGLATMLLEDGPSEESLHHFDQALRWLPDNVEVLSGLARAHHLRGSHAEAIELQRRVTGMRPEDAEASYRLGVFLAASGDLEAAREAFRDSLRVTPGFGPALEALERIERGGRDP